MSLEIRHIGVKVEGVYLKYRFSTGRAGTYISAVIPVGGGGGGKEGSS